MSRIAIAWSGLPFYAARLVRAGLAAVGEPVDVLGSRPGVPLEDVDAALGQPIGWIDARRRTSWAALGRTPPRLFLHTGWAYAAFNALADEVLARGGQVVSLVDNRYRGDLRQRLGRHVFRLRLRKRFAALWVPGASGERLARFLGMPPDRIVRGLYGADPDVFRPGPPLAARPVAFTFVGQLIPRKGVPELLEAFRRARARVPGLRLRIVGQGPLERLVSACEGVEAIPFRQPPEVARLLAESRFLVLPSLDEHWGLVVHEATLAGCGLVLADAVAAGEDLLVPGLNGTQVPAGSVDALADALAGLAASPPARLAAISAASLRAAASFGPDRWAATFASLARRLLPQDRGVGG